MERETGFEPATSTLARSHSTTELFPLARKPSSYHSAAGQTTTVRLLGTAICIPARRAVHPTAMTAVFTRLASLASATIAFLLRVAKRISRPGSGPKLSVS
jgi:hypothetical protein